MVPTEWRDQLYDNAKAIDLLRPRSGCDALRAGFRLIDEAHKESLERLILKKLPEAKPEPNAATTINFTSVRTKGVSLSDLELSATDAVKLQDYAKILDRQLTKMLKNSVYGRIQNPPTFSMMEKPNFTAELFTTDEYVLPHRVKIRCPDFASNPRLYPSESHACEDHARDAVVPWNHDNIAGEWIQKSYAVFAFADFTDATLCYMRFK